MEGTFKDLLVQVPLPWRTETFFPQAPEVFVNVIWNTGSREYVIGQAIFFNMFIHVCSFAPSLLLLIYEALLLASASLTQMFFYNLHSFLSFICIYLFIFKNRAGLLLHWLAFEELLAKEVSAELAHSRTEILVRVRT